MGLPPHAPLGDFIPKPHLRYAAVLSGLAESGFVSLRFLILAFLNRFAMGGYYEVATPCPVWGFHPQTPSPLRGSFNMFYISYREAIA